CHYVYGHIYIHRHIYSHTNTHIINISIKPGHNAQFFFQLNQRKWFTNLNYQHRKCNRGQDFRSINRVLHVNDGVNIKNLKYKTKFSIFIYEKFICVVPVDAAEEIHFAYMEHSKPGSSTIFYTR